MANETRLGKNNDALTRQKLLALHADDEQRNSVLVIFLQVLTCIVFVLGAVQYTYGILNHASLVSIQFASSGLAFCCSVELLVRRFHRKDIAVVQSVFLLYRTAGAIFFIAVSFLNLTHCLEDLSDLKDGGKDFGLDSLFKYLSHATTTAAPLADQDHHDHHVSMNVLYISLADLIIKSMYAIFHNALTINPLATFTILVSPSAFTILVFYYNYNELEYFNDWFNHHLEPVTSILLTVVCLTIAIYSLFQKKRFLFAEGPKNFSIEKITESVKSSNENLEKVDHVHASCEWPGGFTVSLKAYIKVDKNNKDWVSQAATDYSQLKTLLHSEIKEQGANEVIVEPVFVDHNENTVFNDPICIDSSCHNQNVGCCTIPTTKATENTV